jgi:hypothetical protein
LRLSPLKQLSLRLINHFRYQETVTRRFLSKRLELLILVLSVRDGFCPEQNGALGRGVARLCGEFVVIKRASLNYFKIG